MSSGVTGRQPAVDPPEATAATSTISAEAIPDGGSAIPGTLPSPAPILADPPEATTATSTIGAVAMPDGGITIPRTSPSSAPILAKMPVLIPDGDAIMGDENQHLKRRRNALGENKGQGKSQPGMITTQDVQEESPFFTLSSPTPVTWSFPVPPALPDDSDSADSMGLIW